MALSEKEAVERLKPGYYPFSNRGRFIEMEIDEFPGRRLSFWVRVEASKVGIDGGREVAMRMKGNVGEGIYGAVKDLPVEAREIVSEFAIQRMEQEERIREYEERVSAYRGARSRTSRTGEIDAEFILFKSDRF